MPISKNKIKELNSLKIKKYRDEKRQFICEGEKIFEALYNSNFKIIEVYALPQFIEKWQEKYSKMKFETVDETELKKISNLTNPQPVIAIVEIQETSLEKIDFNEKLSLVLDNVNDPGNLGTIIRIADWFGIENIVCSENTVELYNPKVVQATMGSIFSVMVHYTDLAEFFRKYSGLSIYGTFMNGDNIYTSELTKNGFIVLGNEANGISPEIEKFVTKKLAIPSYNEQKTAESLNVAISAAVVCAEFYRKF